MNMTISAVQLGASSQPQAKTSETGFSDVLTEVRTAAPQISDYSAQGSQAQTAEAVQMPATEDITVQAEIPEAMTAQTELADISFTAEFEQTVISLITKETGITPDDSEEMGKIIDALLKILKKMNSKTEDDTAVNMVMELLTAMLGETGNTPVIDFTFKQAETSITAINTEISAELTAILSAETQTVDAAAVQTQTNAPTETEIPEAAAQAEAPAQPADTYEKLLNDILNEARKELGLTKAEFTQTAETTEIAAETEIPVQTAKETAGTALHLNRKDGTDELNSILGNTADEPEAKQETVAPAAQDNSAAFAGNTLTRTETAPAETEIKVEIPLPEQQLADEILSKPEAVNGGRTEFTMELNPESLGKITVRLVSAEGRVEVNITAENDATRQLLEARADNIGAALRSNGVELERYQVVSGQEEAQLMQESYDGSSKNPYGRNDEEQQNNEDSENEFLEILQQL